MRIIYGTINYRILPFEHTNELVVRIKNFETSFIHYDFYEHQKDICYEYFKLNHLLHSRLKTPKETIGNYNLSVLDYSFCEMRLKNETNSKS